MLNISGSTLSYKRATLFYSATAQLFRGNG